MINGYYTSTQVDNALASYLTSSNASSTYLTQSNAVSTYLTQSNAASTYLPLSGGTLTGGLSGTSITGTSFAYPSAQTKILNIPANDFNARSDIVLTYNEGGNSYYRASGTENTVDTGVNLPNGAVVTAATLYVYDNSASSTSATLYRRSLTATTGDSLASMTSSGDGTTAGWSSTDSTIGDATIDNDNFSYHFQVSLTSSSSSLYFRGARITYTISSL